MGEESGKVGERMKISIQYLLPEHKQSESDILTLELDGGKVKSLQFHHIRKKHGVINTTPCKAEIIQVASDDNNRCNNTVSAIKPDGTVIFELNKPVSE